MGMYMNKEVQPLVRRTLELAWEAFLAGSFPVGAVLTDSSGVVVAEGRNRMGESDAPAGRLRATGLAHAEMDVLAQLPIGDYADYTLYTSLEPCLLCRAASTMSHIGTVRFVAADSLCDGLDQLPTINGHASRRYPAMFGPLTGPYARFASVLPMATLLAFNPSGETSDHYRVHAPDAFAAAAEIVANDDWPARAQELDAAVAHIETVSQRVRQPDVS
jgi:tRNA(adenine34) deaminase